MDRDLLRARYVTFAALAIVSSIFFLAELPWPPLADVAAGVLTAALITTVLEIWLRISLRRSGTGPKPAPGEDESIELRRQLDLSLDVQHRLLEARSEKDILEIILQAGASTLQANSASFVPYDEWGKALPALFHGNVPSDALQSWSRRLESPETRQMCKNCNELHGSPGCVLLPVTSKIANTAVSCFALHHNNREAGVFNFFFENESEIPLEKRNFIAGLIQSAGKALENLLARDQEIAALRHLQKNTAPQTQLPELLKNLLENVQQALDVDFALLYIPNGNQPGGTSAPQLYSQARAGDVPETIPNLPFLEGIWKSVLDSGHSVSLENVRLNQHERWKMLLAVPLVWRNETPYGVLVLGSNSAQALSERHLALLETLAGQAALLLQNAQLMIQVEYQAVVEERTRLAREIHDGLAQTLAFLKIQAAQMQNYLTRGETERLSSTLQASYRTLSDAYLDARQAIDNLRRIPSASLRDWVGQVASDFEQSTDIKVDLSDFNLVLDYPPNHQAQLLRIVQEALSNARKHAKATGVSIRGTRCDKDALIEIIDNGIGFSPDQVDVTARYGLRGMKERAEMIGADFQISSQPGNGTTISLRLPVNVKEEA
jgi:two-component system nitrate/nitrite sensor histidine kinase NarX